MKRVKSAKGQVVIYIGLKMGVLPSKAEREARNIDRLNKGLVWSALQLRQQIKANAEANVKYGEWIQVSHELVKFINGTNQPRLNLSIQLILNSAFFLVNGGLIGESIGSFTQSAITATDRIFRKSVEPLFPSLPTWVVTLEQYCYFCSITYAATLTEETRKQIDIKINEKQNPNAYIQIVASLPLMFDPFVNNLSYVDSLNASLPPAIFMPALINNVSPLGNTLLFGN